MCDGVKAKNRDLDLDQMIRKKTKHRQRSAQEERKSRYRNFRQYLLILRNEKSRRIAKQYNTKTNIFNIAHISGDLAYLFLQQLALVSGLNSSFLAESFDSSPVSSVTFWCLGFPDHSSPTPTPTSQPSPTTRTEVLFKGVKPFKLFLILPFFFLFY